MGHPNIVCCISCHSSPRSRDLVSGLRLLKCQPLPALPPGRCSCVSDGTSPSLSYSVSEMGTMRTPTYKVTERKECNAGCPGTSPVPGSDLDVQKTLRSLLATHGKLQVQVKLLACSSSLARVEKGRDSQGPLTCSLLSVLSLPRVNYILKMSNGTFQKQLKSQAMLGRVLESGVVLLLPRTGLRPSSPASDLPYRGSLPVRHLSHQSSCHGVPPISEGPRGLWA